MAAKLFNEIPQNTIFRADRFYEPGRKHYILWVWETERSWGNYILPIYDFFCVNEFIQVNNGTLYLEIACLSNDTNGDPVVIVDKIKSNRPCNRHGYLGCSFFHSYIIICY